MTTYTSTINPNVPGNNAPLSSATVRANFAAANADVNALAALVASGAGTVGPAGPTGATGAQGATGAAGVGVPAGGTTGQFLKKNSGTDYDTVWSTLAGTATSSPDAVTRVNLAAIGDSRVFLNHTNNPGYRFNNGTLNQAVALTNERFSWKAAYNLGVSGDTAQGVDGRTAQVATVMAMRPASEEWDLYYWVDINDALAGVTATAFLGYFKSSMKKFADMGIRNIYVQGGVPYPLGYVYNGAAQTQSQHDATIALIKSYNAGMADYCSTQANCHFVDAYAAYGGGADVPLLPNTDIHPGAGGAELIAGVIGPILAAWRGKRFGSHGVSIVKNPYLYGTDGATPDAYYASTSTNATVTRDKANNALQVALNGGSSNAVYNIFCNAEALNDTLMPGDEIKAFLDCQTLSATGPAEGASLRMDITNPASSNAVVAFQWANAVTSGYTKYEQAGNRKLYASDAYTIPAKGYVPVTYLNLSAPSGSTLTMNIFEASVRRTYASPNAEYSAAATLPAHRKNIRCLTSTATAGFTLTLPPLATADDGDVRVFADTQGNASTNNVTIKGNASELIIDGAAGANTVVKSTNYFTASYRCDKGANAWVRQ